MVFFFQWIIKTIFWSDITKKKIKKKCSNYEDINCRSLSEFIPESLGTRKRKKELRHRNGFRRKFWNFRSVAIIFPFFSAQSTQHALFQLGLKAGLAKTKVTRKYVFIITTLPTGATRIIETLAVFPCILIGKRVIIPELGWLQLFRALALLD